MSIRREFVMLAHNLEDKRDRLYLGQWRMSEKMDGQRCMWDGGVTIGMDPKDVPWANTAKERRLNPPKSTGLWSRYGKVIQVPKHVTDKLPKDQLLDGELYLGRGRFQSLMSALKSGFWNHKIRFMVFDMPTPAAWLGTFGLVKSPNYTHLFPVKYQMRETKPMLIDDVVAACRGAKLDYAEQRPFHPADMEDWLAEITEGKGEGIVLRQSSLVWTPYRTDRMLKVKPMKDSEATVIGYTWGKDGKLEGMIGNCIMQWGDKVFELSGFTDAERRVNYPELWVAGGRIPESVEGALIKRGDVLSFHYRELTVGGIPKEARYWRKREDV